MKIKAGYYRTSDGRRARVFVDDAPGEMCCAGFIEDPKGGPNSLCAWRTDGWTDMSSRALIGPWKDEISATVEVYVLLDQRGAVYLSTTPPLTKMAGFKKLNVLVKEGDVG